MGGARGQIRSGDLLAWRGATALDELIEHFSGGSYCHVGIALVENGEIQVLQAMEGRGVEKVSLSDHLPCDWIETAIAWTAETEAFALAKLGQRYSYLDALEVGLGFAPTDTRGLICSTYARAVLLKARLDLPLKGLTPAALVNDLLDLGCPLQNVGGSGVRAGAD